MIPDAKSFTKYSHLFWLYKKRKWWENFLFENSLEIAPFSNMILWSDLSLLFAQRGLTKPNYAKTVFCLYLWHIWAARRSRGWCCHMNVTIYHSRTRWCCHPGKSRTRTKCAQKLMISLSRRSAYHCESCSSWPQKKVTPLWSPYCSWHTRQRNRVSEWISWKITFSRGTRARWNHSTHTMSPSCSYIGPRTRDEVYFSPIW
jgi:hypothetical protein